MQKWTVSFARSRSAHFFFAAKAFLQQSIQLCHLAAQAALSSRSASSFVISQRKQLCHLAAQSALSSRSASSFVISQRKRRDLQSRQSMPGSSALLRESVRGGTGHRVQLRVMPSC
jgi:hypothetical protein